MSSLITFGVALSIALILFIWLRLSDRLTSRLVDPAEIRTAKRIQTLVSCLICVVGVLTFAVLMVLVSPSTVAVSSASSLVILMCFCAAISLAYSLVLVALYAMIKDIVWQGFCLFLLNISMLVIITYGTFYLLSNGFLDGLFVLENQA